MQLRPEKDTAFQGEGDEGGEHYGEVGEEEHQGKGEEEEHQGKGGEEEHQGKVGQDRSHQKDTEYPQEDTFVLDRDYIELREHQKNGEKGEHYGEVGEEEHYGEVGKDKSHQKGTGYPQEDTFVLDLDCIELR